MYDICCVSNEIIYIDNRLGIVVVFTPSTYSSTEMIMKTIEVCVCELPQSH